MFAVSAFGDGDLTIARLDPATGAVSATAALPGDLDADGLGPRALAVGGDSVWVVGATAVARVDPASLEVTGRFEVDAGPGGIRLATFAGGALFALVENGAALLRIDGEGTVTDRLVLSEEPVEWRLPASLAAGRGHVWVMVQAGSDPARHDVRIVRVDPATGAATGVFTVASELFAGAIAVS
ncbi:MAG: glutaminyl-peptide cyclotransferase [Acidimicrobiia bacterium]|nr:glutaminyl-peptide cyclotransferase [Acidimicrobiia bacterium]